jgi:general secretion pathway protein H
MKSMKNLKSKKGFTLIELLVVLALIGVSVGVIGISASSTARNNLKQTTNSVNSMLARCRVNSLYRAEPVYVEFAISGGNVVSRYFESGTDGNLIMIDEQIMGRAAIDVTYTIAGEAVPRNISTHPLRVSFTRRGALVLVERYIEDSEERIRRIDGELTEIQFSNGTITYVIAITPETGNRRVRAG